MDDDDAVESNLEAHPIYTDCSLLASIQLSTRQSSRLKGVPRVDYRENRSYRTVDKMTSDDEDSEESTIPDAATELLDTPELVSDEEADAESGPEEVAPLVVTAGDAGMPLPGCLKGLYSEDKFFADILKNPNNFTNFVVRNGFVYFCSEGMEYLTIPDVVVDGRRVREVVISHTHSLLAHLGAAKTLTYLRDQVWWKTMVADVTDYCKSCGICSTSKSGTTKPQGLLKTMPVPTYPWQYIGIDFVGPLPESENHNGTFDMICVVIDHLSAMVHLVPTRQDYTAVDMAGVIFESVYRLHGLPERLVSDRDSLFTSHFWRRLHELLNVDIRLSSAYHPQTDGATERANRTMTQMLRQCVQPDQKDWAVKLPAIEFAMNSARSDSSGMTPFYLNYGRTPSPIIWNAKSEYPGVHKFAQDIKLAVMSAHDSIIEARIRQTVQAN
jgi:hypothetical protein